MPPSGKPRRQPSARRGGPTPRSGPDRREPPRPGLRRPALPPPPKPPVAPPPAEPAGPVAGPTFAASNAREAAFQVLELARDHQVRLSEVWKKIQFSAALSPSDRNLSRELAFGAVRREITIEFLLRKLIQRAPDEIEPPLKSILALGVYQLLFADHIPPHAAVHETVELAKKVGRLRWAGFVNGVLRAASRWRTDEFTAEASARTLPVGELVDSQENSSQGSIAHGPFRCLTEPVFPDPQHDFANYFQSAYGFPEWLSQRWVTRWPSDVLHRLGLWQRSVPPVFLRVNLQRTTRAELLAKFAERGLAAVAESLPESVRMLSGGRIEDWPGYAEGLFSVQDLSAMRAARRLAPAPGSSVLDLCAAPGGKSCHLAEFMGDRGEVIAVDVTPVRLNRIVENAERLQLKTIHALLVTEDGRDLPRGPFDFVLADVPCSNTGVIGRRPEVLWKLTPETIAELSLLQGDLLQRAAQRVKPGGRLLYSTCSIEAEENEQVVEKFLRHWPEFRLLEAELLLPGSPADGGYQALLERSR